MGCKTYHMSQSVDGALANWKSSEWREVCKNDDGEYMTPAAVKKEFLRLQANGVKLIPIGNCDNFDPEKGCLGHDQDDDGDDL